MTSDEAEQQIRDLNEQVKKLHRQGKYAEALEMARRVCEVAPRMLGEDHPETAGALGDLGSLLLDMGK